MSAFMVTAIIDGDTFDVTPQRQWNGQTGSRVRPAGYDAPELHAYGSQAATDKLSRLIRGQQVDLREATESTAVAWSARSFCEIGTLQTTSLSANNPLNGELRHLAYFEDRNSKNRNNP